MVKYVIDQEAADALTTWLLEGENMRYAKDCPNFFPRVTMEVETKPCPVSIRVEKNSDGSTLRVKATQLSFLQDIKFMIKKMNVADYLDKDVVELFTDGGQRFVHFMGYGYYVGESMNEKPEQVYRFLEFVHNTIPIEKFVNDPEDMSSDLYNEYFNTGHHEYIEDCDEARVLSIYETGFGGMLKPISRSTAASLPDGFYLWDSLGEKEEKIVDAFREMTARTINSLIELEWQAAEIQDALGLTYDAFQSYIR